jgi:hypothetical protein
VFKLILLALVFGGYSAFSQDDYSARSEIGGDIPTIATQSAKDGEKFSKEKTANYPKKLDYLLSRKPTRILYGNPCAEEVTYNLGFKYVLVPKTMAEGYSNESIFWHNFRTHFKLMFKSGFFYKHKARKGIKRCRTSSGDFVY